VARNLFKLMAYKDEYEVGRLYTSGEFEAKLKEQFAGDYKLSFHLAPPLLARRDPVTGHPRKKAFGSYMLPMFRLLAKAKVLRGTPFDPFGYTAERRTERRLIEEYVELVSGILADLDAANHDRAVKLAAYPDSIRGFGHIKARNLAAAMREREESLAAFQNPAVRELEAAE
jgi:indolepyruvate ferredoxin oxidoreductase